MATDFHKELRDAVRDALETALLAEEVPVKVYAHDAPDPNLVDLPAVIVSYGGTEQSRGGTNARDDFAYPMLVGLYTLQPSADTGGADSEPPGLRPTLFRGIVRETFHNRRVVTAPAGCSLFPSEFDPQPPVNDDVSPQAVSQLRTAVGVTVPARVPRGS